MTITHLELNTILKMKFHPILFSTEMVSAILDNRKAMTRRTTGLDFVNENPIDYQFNGFLNYEDEKSRMQAYFQEIGTLHCDRVKFPYGKVGDVLWVMLDHAADLLEGAKERTQFVYKASVHSDFIQYSKERYGYKWKPAIHMPKAACRIFLEITNIRVERLNDISEKDAIAEGVRRFYSTLFDEMRYKDYLDFESNWRSPVSSFESLWLSINGKGSWELNPWVWVIEFKRIEKPSNFLQS